MTPQEKEFWDDLYSKEAKEIQDKKNIKSANKVVGVLTIIVAVVWVLVKI